jgi:hypothetical protein
MQNPLRCKTCTPDRPEREQNRVDTQKHRLVQAEEPTRAAGFIELPTAPGTTTLHDLITIILVKTVEAQRDRRLFSSSIMSRGEKPRGWTGTAPG